MPALEDINIQVKLQNNILASYISNGKEGLVLQIFVRKVVIVGVAISVDRVKMAWCKRLPAMAEKNIQVNFNVS